MIEYVIKNHVEDIAIYFKDEKKDNLIKFKTNNRFMEFLKCNKILKNIKFFYK